MTRSRRPSTTLIHPLVTLAYVIIGASSDLAVGLATRPRVGLACGAPGLGRSGSSAGAWATRRSGCPKRRPSAAEQNRELAAPPPQAHEAETARRPRGRIAQCFVITRAEARSPSREAQRRCSEAPSPRLSEEALARTSIQFTGPGRHQVRPGAHRRAGGPDATPGGDRATPATLPRDLGPLRVGRPGYGAAASERGSTLNEGVAALREGHERPQQETHNLGHGAALAAGAGAGGAKALRRAVEAAGMLDARRLRRAAARRPSEGGTAAPRHGGASPGRWR